MKPLHVSESWGTYLKVKKESQNFRTSIDLKKHNRLLKTIKKEKLRPLKHPLNNDHSSAKRARKLRQSLLVSLPIALYNNYLKKLGKNMNYQPSLRGVKNVRKQPMSLHAKPLGGKTTTSKDPTESQPSLTDKNSVDSKNLPVTQKIPVTQQKSHIKPLLSTTDQITTQISSEQVVHTENQILTKGITRAVKSPTNSMSTVNHVPRPNKVDEICQTDYEIFLSNEETELLFILKNNDINKDILLDLIHNHSSTANNKQPNSSDNNMEIINLEGDAPNELANQLEINNDIFDTVRVHSDINKMFINLMYMIEEIKQKSSTLTQKGKQDVNHCLVKIFYNFFNEESGGEGGVSSVDKTTQTTNMNTNMDNPNKRRYQSAMPNTDTAESNKIMNSDVQKQTQPPLPPQRSVQPQEQQWLEQYKSMNQPNINNQKVNKQKSNQNTSTSTTYSTNTQSYCGPQQQWFYPPQSTGAYARNDPRIYRADAPQGFPRHPGWYNYQDQTNHYGQYGYQYQQPYNMPYPQRWYNQQMHNNSG